MAKESSYPRVTAPTGTLLVRVVDDADGSPATGSMDSDVLATVLGAGASPAANNVVFTPAGGLIATDVQAALVELDNEKLNIADVSPASFGVGLHQSGGTLSGDVFGYAFTYSATTTDSDPGAGVIRLNNATVASATTMYIDLADAYGNDVTAWLDFLDDSPNPTKGVLLTRSLSNPSVWAWWRVTAWTTATGYRKITVTYYAGAGSFTTTVGDTLLSFIRNPAQSEVIVIPIGDETTTITTGTAKVTFRMPFKMNLTEVRASLATTSSSGTPTFDINEAGASILSTKLTIDASELTSTTAATPAVISDATLADDAEMTIDVDVAGTGAKGAKITLIGFRSN